MENRRTGGDPDYRWFPPDPPVVHLLGAATGLEEHTVTGLTSPRVADLTGDGLADLWGAVDGKLVAIHAEPAEAWRALDELHAAGDFDGDGISDLLSNDFEAPPIWPIRPMDRQTALARSGRDGRLLWQTRLDAWEKPGSSGRRGRSGTSSRLWPFPEATWTVMESRISSSVRGWRGDTLAAGGTLGPHGQVALVDSDFAGGGARRLAGRDIEGIDARACHSGGSPDVFLMYDLWFAPAPGPGPRPVDRQCRLARISGRDGHVVWDVLLADYQGGANRPVGFFHEIADLDGSGDREIVVLLPR